MTIKKAVIPIAGLGTRFLPLSMIIPKEFFPLGSKPVIQYIVEEALEAGINEFIFVLSPAKRDIFKNYILKYFGQSKKSISSFSSLSKEKKKKISEILKEIPKIKCQMVIQKKPLGDGDAILKTEKLIGNEPFLVLFGDDVSWAKKKIGAQLVETFKKNRETFISLYQMPKSKLFAYGVPKIKKIGKRLYKINDLIEKPKHTPPSNFAVVGKYILTPDIFFYLKKTNPKNGEIILLEALKEKIKEGKPVLGLHIKGKWLECGDKEKWIKSFISLTK